jgi:hypothetical protein
VTESIRTTWREPRSRLVHAVNIEGMRPGERGQGYADEIRTDCGIRVPAVTLEDDGDITCIICLERSWLEQTLEGLQSTASEPAALPADHAQPASAAGGSAATPTVSGAPR